MPRGNDADAALHELADQFGRGVGNAEELIDANLSRNTEALRTAEALPRDEALTKEALEHIDDYEGPNGEEVVDVAVHKAQTGRPRTVIVYRTKEGRDLLAAVDEDGEVITAASEREERSKGEAKGSRKKAKTDKASGNEAGSDKK